MGQLCLNTQTENMMKSSLLTLTCLVYASYTQLKFGGSSSNSGTNNKQGSSNSGSNNGQTDTRFLTSGNEFVDGGLLGVAAGVVGGSILSGALNGANNNQGYNNGYNPCGRRRRQAEDGTNTKFFNFGGSSGCNCGRKRRQAPGENEPGTRFFGLENLLGGGSNNNCGCNCGYPSNNYPSNNYPSNNYPSNSGNYQQQCQCNNNLTFRDKYGNVHGACRRPDETGKTWCYTYGGCPDSRPSSRFPNNPWSYQACTYYG